MQVVWYYVCRRAIELHQLANGSDGSVDTLQAILSIATVCAVVLVGVAVCTLLFIGVMRLIFRGLL